MVKFGEITSKTVRVPYTKDDVEGYVVTGYVTYNKDNKISDANGSIKEGKIVISNFDIYGEGEETRINLNDCLAGRMGDAVILAEATLADLAEGYPAE